MEPMLNNIMFKIGIRNYSEGHFMQAQKEFDRQVCLNRYDSLFVTVAMLIVGFNGKNEAVYGAVNLG